MKKISSIILTFLLAGCDLAKTGFYMAISPPPEIVDISFGKQQTKVIEIEQLVGKPYAFYLKTKLRTNQKNAFKPKNSVDFVTYPYDFTIKGYKINSKEERVLIMDERFTENRQTFKKFGLASEFSDSIYHFDLSSGKYQFEIKDNTQPNPIYSKIDTSIELVVDAIIQ
ncbi:hypothetical protein ACKLNO_09385 [Neisseriaceae bacterium B1]